MSDIEWWIEPEDEDYEDICGNCHCRMPDDGSACPCEEEGDALLEREP